MGGTFSTPKHLSGHDDGGPPQKRRRLSSPEALDPGRYLGSPGASENRSALRVEVLKVFHKDSKKVRSLQATVLPRDILTTRGRCRITISDMSEVGFAHILYRESKVCDITTYKNPVGPHRVARIDLHQPFLVPEETIRVNREDDVSHDLGESYKLEVELESINDGSWPPLESHDFGIPLGEQGPLSDSAKRHWILHSEFEKVWGRSKKPVRLTTGYRSQRPFRPTEYVMDVDLRWTAGFRPLDKGSKACITAIDPDAEPYTTGQLEPIPDDQLNGVSTENGVNGVNGVHDTNGINGIHDTDGVDGINGVNGHVHEDSSHEQDDDLDGNQTPSRALRVRERNKVYNLKVLSDQAQGKERKRRARAAHAATAEGRVTYCLPIDQPVCLDFWRCISCGMYHDSLAHLQLHLQTFHSNYDYVLETASQGPQFRVTRRLESVATPTRTYQLGKPVKAFNLETYVNGDQSAVSSRIGPDNNEEPLRSPSKPAAARQLFDKGSTKPPQPAQPAEVRPKKRKIIIPETSHPLFDPVSKSRLLPGEELPKPVIDNSWLIQKHRDDIGEFSDVTPEEKEYIRKWDAFILQETITSGAYFPRAWLKFVHEQASWLAGVPHRMTEFGKHTSVLMARDVLDGKVLDDAMRLIDEARAQLRSKKDDQPNGTNGTHTTDAPLKQSPRTYQVARGANGCTVCELPVLGPSLLVCSNKDCSRRLYHADCIQKDAITPVTRPKWLCNECSKPAGAS
ncbi:hypothetical protein ACJZ2D_002207 [Fusarium nematophilum]